MLTRVATAKDVEAIRRLELEAFGFTWSEDTFRRELKREDSLYTVGLDTNEIVAMASVNWILDEVHLVSIAVASAWQRKGYATQLLGENLAFCRGLGLNWMTLEVKWDNYPALALYKAFNFSTAGKRKKYYRDGTDARIMWSGCLKDLAYEECLKPYGPSAHGIETEWRHTRS